MDEDSEPIIMDIGSGHLKAGFANDSATTSTEPFKFFVDILTLTTRSKPDGRSYVKNSSNTKRQPIIIPPSE